MEMDIISNFLVGIGTIFLAFVSLFVLRQSNKIAKISIELSKTSVEIERKRLEIEELKDIPELKIEDVFFVGKNGAFSIDNVGGKTAFVKQIVVFLEGSKLLNLDSPFKILPKSHTVEEIKFDEEILNKTDSLLITAVYKTVDDDKCENQGKMFRFKVLPRSPHGETHFVLKSENHL